MDRSATPASVTGATVQDCLTCYLCGDIFRRPRVLPCGHTFCSECLARLKDEIVGNGHYQGHETPSETIDFIDSNYRDWLRPADHSKSPKQHKHASPGGSSKNSDDSSNVDYLEANPNCYRPHSYGRSQFRKSDPCESYQHSSDGIVISSALTRRRPKSESESSHSCFTASSDNLMTSKSCAQCGHVYHPTQYNKEKLPQRTSSFHDKSPKSRNGSRTNPRWDSSPQRTLSSHLPAPVGSFEQKHGREMEQFVCPLPDCNFSIRIMNLARWSPRNKTVADVVGVWRRLHENKQDTSTQTDISTSQSLLVTIPRSLIDSQSVQTLGHRRRHSSMVDMAINSAVSMDSLDSGYIPTGHMNWRSYAAMTRRSAGNCSRPMISSGVNPCRTSTMAYFTNS